MADWWFKAAIKLAQAPGLNGGFADRALFVDEEQSWLTAIVVGLAEKQELSLVMPIWQMRDLRQLVQVDPQEVENLLLELDGPLRVIEIRDATNAGTGALP